MRATRPPVFLGLFSCMLLLSSSHRATDAFSLGANLPASGASGTKRSATNIEPSLTPHEEKVHGFLQDLWNKDFRIVVIGNGAILESTNLLGPSMSMSPSPKSGANLVTFASHDKSFELHLQIAQVARVALVERETPGRTMRILRLSDDKGQSICSLIMSEDSEVTREWFHLMKAKYGDEWQV